VPREGATSSHKSVARIKITYTYLLNFLGQTMALEKSQIEEYRRRQATK
jgi:hypothetical protein